MNMRRYLICCILIFPVFYFSGHADVAGRETRSGDSSGIWDGLCSFWSGISDFFIPHYEERKIVFETETNYYHVLVEDDCEGKRHLIFGSRKGTQSMFFPNKPETLASSYMRHAFTALSALERKPERVLFIGLGGGVMPMFLRRHFPEALIDIVEIDKDLLPVAVDYFSFEKDPRMRIVFKDARLFAKKEPEGQYDLIFLDAYNGDYIPFHLATVDFFKCLKRLLKPEGVLAMNIANFGNTKFIRSEFKTLKKVFPYMRVVVCPNETNFIPLASENNLLELPALISRANDLDNTYTFNMSLEEMLSNMMAEAELDEYLNDSKAIIYTDDYAPVNH